VGRRALSGQRGGAGGPGHPAASGGRQSGWRRVLAVGGVGVEPDRPPAPAGPGAPARRPGVGGAGGPGSPTWSEPAPAGPGHQSRRSLWTELTAPAGPEAQPGGPGAGRRKWAVRAVSASAGPRRTWRSGSGTPSAGQLPAGSRPRDPPHPAEAPMNMPSSGGDRAGEDRDRARRLPASAGAPRGMNSGSGHPGRRAVGQSTGRARRGRCRRRL
jgi:hypothetical protein